ncbi:MAG TPA: DUF1566 domain-containing protein [Terriglobales bacterium]|nr:DUF1566 domain-containing protein [Terriglobales bacterium]
MSISPKMFAIFALMLPALTACDRPRVPAYEFHLTRIDASGREQRDQPRFAERPWACVLDENTGLMWEVKTNGDGLHAAGNTYTWYSGDGNANKGYEGKRDGGTCTGSACDTESFVAAVNAERLCGHSDWRMPSTDEASTLIDTTIRFPGPTIPKDYFPNTRSGKDGYWTGTAFDKHRSGAWAWRFDHGADFVAMKDQPRYARAVRGDR